MAQHSIIPPARYRIATGQRPGAPGELAYFILRREELAPDCWREVAGPYVRRGGAIQRLDRIIARGEDPGEREEEEEQLDRQHNQHKR